jgi:hypothetical protein
MDGHSKPPSLKRDLHYRIGGKQSVGATLP